MSRVRAPQAVLWDMDGTLINTEPLWAQATFELSEFLGKRLSAEERRKAEGVSFPTALSIITTWTGYSLAARRYRAAEAVDARTDAATPRARY